MHYYFANIISLIAFLFSQQYLCKNSVGDPDLGFQQLRQFGPTLMVRSKIRSRLHGLLS